METQTGYRWDVKMGIGVRLVVSGWMWIDAILKKSCLQCSVRSNWYVETYRLEKMMFKGWAMIACCSPLRKISSSSSSTTLAKTGAGQCNHFHQSSNIKHEKTDTTLHHFTPLHTPFSQSTSLKWNQSSLVLAVKGIAGCRSRKMRPLLLSGAKWSLRWASKIECDRTVDSLHLSDILRWHGSSNYTTWLNITSFFQQSRSFPTSRPDLPRYKKV